MMKMLQNIGYTRCWDDEQLRQRVMQNMGNLFAGGNAVPEEPNWQLALDADDDLLLDEGGKTMRYCMTSRGACGCFRLVQCAVPPTAW